MADIRLVRPEAGTNQAVACEPEARFVFDFPTDAATLSRNGDNLVMTFEDGATLTLTDFYKVYSSKNMPNFEVDGAQVAGADFFAAMNEPDLMPAAGPGGRAAAAGVGGGRYHEYANMALYDGLDRLGGLDVGWPDGGYEPEIDGAAGRRGDEEGGYAFSGDTNGIPSIAPTIPDRPGLDPDTPHIPHSSDPDTPSSPDNPGTPGGGPAGGPAGPSTGRDVLSVSERGLPAGTDPKAPTKATGSMLVESPDGIERLEVGGKVVYDENGFHEADILTDEGVLHVTGFDPETGELTYDYELTEPSREHDKNKGADNKFAHDIPVTVTDPDGDSASSTITVVIEDDAPEAKDDSVTLGEKERVTGNVLQGTAQVTGTDGQSTRDVNTDPDMFGADEPAEKTVQWHVDAYKDKTDNGDGSWTVHTEYGDVTLRPDGTYDFTASKDGALEYGMEGKLSFGYTITDADGDTSDASLNITVEGNSTPDITPEEPGSKPDPKLGVKAGSIVVDEAAWAADTKGKRAGSGDQDHDYNGSGRFTVDLHGEGGTITLSDGKGGTVTLDVKEDGSYTLHEGSKDGLTVNGVTVTFSDSGNVNNVEYSYTLGGNQPHENEGSAGAVGADDSLGGQIEIHVEDNNGNNTADGYIDVQVHDDGPVVEAKLDPVEEGADPETVLSGTVDLNFGADGQADANALMVQVGEGDDAVTVHGERTDDGNYRFHLNEGDLIVSGKANADGTYNFEFNPKDADKTGSLTFKFVAEDSDHDTDDVEVTVKWNNTPDFTTEEGKPVDPDTPVGSIVVDEALLEKGTGAAPEGYGDGHTPSDKGSFHVDLHGEGGTITLKGADGSEVTLDVKEDGSYTLHEGSKDSLTVNGVTVTFKNSGNVNNVEYSYTLGGNQSHENEGSAGAVGAKDSLGGQIDIHVEDNNGNNTADGYIDVQVHDDGPVVSSTFGLKTAVEGTNVSYKGTIEDFSFGADVDGSQVKVQFGDTTYEGRVSVKNGNVSVDFGNNKGNVSLDSKGNLTLSFDKEHDPFQEGTKTEVTVTVTDNDGDEAVSLTTVTKPDVTPQNPDSTRPEGSVSHIVVDEGTQPEGRNDTVDAEHGSHGQSGPGSFKVQLHGESGTVTLTDMHGKTVEMRIDANGYYTLYDAKGAELSEDFTLQVNGVNVTLKASGQLEKNTDDSWTIPYDWKLSGSQQHGGAENARDTTVNDEEITITVKDVSGDTATGRLTSEVHDDVPVMSGTQENATASVTVGMGADADGVYGGTGDATVKVFEQGSENAVTWTKNDGSGETDLTKMGDDETWTSGNVTVHRYGDQYEFTNYDETEGKQLTVKTTDADGDTVQQDVEMEQAHTDITVGTSGQDTLTPGDLGHEPGTPPSHVESPDDPGTNDFVIGDIYDQRAEGNVGNFAFLVDTSNSEKENDFETMIEGLKSAIQSIIDSLHDGESANVLVAEFNTFTRHAFELQLTKDSTLENIDGKDYALEEFLKQFHRGGVKGDIVAEKYDDYNGKQCYPGYVCNPDDDLPFGGMIGQTNYEHAMNVATQWFNNKKIDSDTNQTVKNQTFFITDGVPTAAVGNDVFTGEVTAVGGDTWSATAEQLIEALQGSGWEVGKSMSVTYGDFTIYVDAAGVLYFDEKYSQLLLAHDDYYSYWPLVIQKNSTGGYELHQVDVLGTSSLGTEDGPDSQAQAALEELAKVSDVVILGIGDEFHEQQGQCDQTGEDILKGIQDGKDNVELHTDLTFSDIAAAIQHSLKDLDPENDLLIGGKGNDILFGDRVDYGRETTYSELDNVTELTQKYLFAMADEVAGKLDGVNRPDKSNLGELAGFIREHAREFGDTLDKKLDNDKGDDVLIGGTGHDVLFGQGGSDILIGDGGDGYLKYLNDQGRNTLRDELKQSENEPTEVLNKLDEFEDAENAHGNDLLFGGRGDDILLGGAGNDKLFGGAGEDILFGGSGNDYLSGGDGKDYLYGGSGDDLIVYDSTDYAVFGGSGIDILLSNDKNADSLSSLLDGIAGDHKPKVQGVELFLKGDGVEDLTSMGDLQQYGITVDDKNGTVTLGEGWSGSDGIYIYKDKGWTLETTLRDAHSQGTDDDAAQHAANEILLTQQG